MPDLIRSEKSIFLQAIEMTYASERAAYLDQACEGNPTLRAEVEALLRAHETPQRVLDSPEAIAPTTDQIPHPEKPGMVIGPYKLLQQIGVGGMGIVYMAEQEQPVRRKVALKIIKPGMDSAQVIARFEAERQALALMDHQNIARVLDVGTTASGRPYFVMELVRGIPITKFCDDNHLTPRERLELFVPVCQAIQHAHQKGIIHRDVKPSNILVALYDGKPVPKVIDFGVAKATQQRLTERTLFTQFGQVVGTVEYMSPEQAEHSALDIDTRSDIYSLGVLLYELLTGSTPLEKQQLRSVAFNEMLRMIREEEPPRPSTRLSESKDQLASISAQRKMEPAKLTKLVRGELDWIVMKALEKDRCRRYETANGFARDIQRYLADEPVEACPPSTVYKLRKFARKNKGLLRTAAAFVLLLAAGAVVSTWQAIRATRAEVKEAERADAEREARLEEKAAKERESEALAATKKALSDVESQRSRAEKNFAKALAVVDDYLTKVSESQLLKTPGMQPLRRELLASALKFYDEFLKERAGDPTIRAELASTYYRVGRVHNDLGASKEANQAFKQAVALLERLVKDNPKNLRYKFNLALSYHRVGNYTQAIALGKELVAADSTNVQLRSELAEVYNSLGLASENGSPEELKAHQEALNLREALARERPDDPEAQVALARTMNNLGVVLNKQGRYAEARDMYLRAVEHHRIAFGKTPWIVNSGRNLAISTNNAAWMQRKLGQNDEALRWHERAIGIWKKLAEDNPAVPSLWESLFAGYHDITGLQRELNHPTEAARWQRQARDAIERIPREEASNLYLLARARARCAESIGWGKKELTSAEKAEQQHEADLTLDALRKAVAAGLMDVAKLNNNPDFTVLRERTEFKALLVKLATSAGQTATVLNANEVSSLMAAQKKQAAADPGNRQLQADLAASQHALGIIQFGQGKMDEAEKHLNQAVTVREALVKDAPKNAHSQADLAASRGYLHLVRARRLAQQKRNKEAEADFREAVELLDDRALEPLASPSEAAASEADKLIAWLADEALLVKLTAAIERNPDDMARRWRRGEWYARRARWKEAAADFTTGLDARMALSSDSAGKAEQWVCVAPLLAIADREGYRRLCREMLKRFGETEDPDTAARIAKGYLLLPEFTPEMEKACQLADRAVSLGKNHPNLVWFLSDKGLADYRRGNFRVVIEGLEPILPADGVGWPSLTTAMHLVVAMAHYQQGEEQAALDHLARAAKLLKEYLIDTVRSPLQKNSRYDRLNWAIAWLLYREARTLIEGAKTATVLNANEAADLVAALKKQAAADPDNRPLRADLAATHHFLGVIQLGQGKTEEARKDLEQALALREALVKEDPKKAQYHTDLATSGFALGDFQWQSGHLVEGARLLQRGLDAQETAARQVPDRTALDGQLGTMLRTIGQRYAHAGLWTEAAAHYGRLIQLKGAGEYDYFCAACLAVRAGDADAYQRACAAMTKQLGERQDFWPVGWLSWACGLAERSGSDPAEVAKRVQALLRTSENNEWLCFILGLAHYRAGQFAEAVAPASRANTLTPNWHGRPMIWPVLAMAHHRLGHVDEARQWLEQANQEWRRLSPLPRAPGDRSVFPSSSEALLKSWHDWIVFEILLSEANALILGQRGEVDCLDLLHRAYLHTKLGEAEKADEEFQAAIRGRAKDAKAWLARGRVYLLLGDKERAKADFARAYELNPDDPHIQKEYEASGGEKKNGR